MEISSDFQLVIQLEVSDKENKTRLIIILYLNNSLKRKFKKATFQNIVMFMAITMALIKIKLSRS